MFRVKHTFVSRETQGIDDKIPGSDLGCRVFLAGLVSAGGALSSR